MNLYQVIKVVHILSATIVFGTGLGIAFFMFRSYFTNNIHEKYYAVRNTVFGDYLFILPSVFMQPLTGVWLISKSAQDWHAYWLILTYTLFAIAGLCWLPVVWIQIQLKNMLANSRQHNTPLPENYYLYFYRWILLGVPAFISLVVIYFLMVIKPA